MFIFDNIISFYLIEMAENTTPRTVENAEIRTNVREVIKFVGFIVTVAAFVYSIKMDIKDLANEYQVDKKVTEIRLQAIELRLSQIEAEQDELQKEREIELKKAAGR